MMIYVVSFSCTCIIGMQSVRLASLSGRSPRNMVTSPCGNGFAHEAQASSDCDPYPAPQGLHAATIVQNLGTSNFFFSFPLGWTCWQEAGQRGQALEKLPSRQATTRSAATCTILSRPPDKGQEDSLIQGQKGHSPKL